VKWGVALSSERDFQVARKPPAIPIRKLRSLPSAHWPLPFGGAPNRRHAGEKRSGESPPRCDTLIRAAKRNQKSVAGSEIYVKS
jgi:hypothetical protein